MTYIIALQLIPNIGKIDPFSPLWNVHFIWTQIVLQTTGIVFPHQQLLLKVWMEISMAWRLLFYLWEYMCMTHSLHIPYMDNHKVKADQLTQREGQGWAWHTPLTSIYGNKWTLGRSRLITWPSWPVCSVPSVWSKVLKEKDPKSVLNILTICIL